MVVTYPAGDLTSTGLIRDPDYIPPRKPYSFHAMLDGILQFSAQTLVDNGRLSFWMPTASDEDQEIPIPTHPYLEIVSVSTQSFNKCAPACPSQQRSGNWTNSRCARVTATHHLPPNSRQGGRSRSHESMGEGETGRPNRRRAEPIPTGLLQQVRDRKGRKEAKMSLRYPVSMYNETAPSNRPQPSPEQHPLPSPKPLTKPQFRT